MDSTADLQRQILKASFFFVLMIGRSLVASAHAMNKRDRKTVSAVEVVFEYVTAIHMIAIIPSRRVRQTLARGASPWFSCG